MRRPLLAATATIATAVALAALGGSPALAAPPTASGQAASSTAARTSPTKPGARPVFVFAVRGGSVVKVRTTGGAATTVAPVEDGYVIDRAGDVFTYDAAAGVVREYPASGSASFPVITDAPGGTDPQLDAEGNGYLRFGDQVVRYPLDSRPTGVVASLPTGTDDVVVAPDGSVLAFSGGFGTEQVTTFPPGGGTPNVRAIGSGYQATIDTPEVDSRGAIYHYSINSGASGNRFYEKIALDGTVTPIGTHLSYEAGALGPQGFSLFETASWCAAPSLAGPHPCVPDHRATTLTRYALDGTATTVPVSGYTVPDNGAQGSISVGSDNAVYVATSTGLLKYAATGGAPTVLLRGAVSSPHVVTP
ncbi:hypothetical protein ACPEEZ_13545 [Frigoribacterium sp. 2-23]|uniref:hypothetical protein n=1 Tax=Frigoribacterium sp. 2-23 TaxID=3415006 RepID=UPI003C6F6CEB